MPVLTSVSAEGTVLTVEYILTDGTMHKEQYSYANPAAAKRHMPGVVAEAQARADAFEAGHALPTSRQRVRKLADIWLLAIGEIRVFYSEPEDYRRLPRPVVAFEGRKFYLGYRWRDGERVVGFARRTLFEKHERPIASE